jgi:Domain of unknown function (DUF4160)
MPTIAIFNGIIIQMFFEDHDPPHVHAIYGSAKALVQISDGEVIRGALPTPSLPSPASGGGKGGGRDW